MKKSTSESKRAIYRSKRNRAASGKHARVRIAQIEPSQARPNPRRAARRNFVARLMTVAIMDRGCYSQLAISRYSFAPNRTPLLESWLVFPVNYAFCACVARTNVGNLRRDRARDQSRNEIGEAGPPQPRAEESRKPKPIHLCVR